MKTPGLHKLAGACALLFGTLGPVVLPASLAHAYVAWQEGTTYAAGSKVTFNARDYEALVSHTAYVGANWNPAATPTLWRDLGPTSGTPSPTPSPMPTGCTTPYTLWSASSGYGAGACVYVVLNANTSCPSQSNYRALQTVPAGTALGNSSYWKPEPSPAVCLPVTPRPTPFNPTPTPTPTPTPPVTPVVTAPEWSATQVYTGGLRVCYRGILYEARWWVHGDIPDPNNEWGPWRKIGVCPSGPRPSPIAATPTPTPVVTPTLYLPLPTPLPTPLPPISAAPIDWALISMGMTVADIAFTIQEADTAFVPTYWALQGPGNRLYPLSDPVVQRAGQAGAYYYGGIAVASELQNSSPGGYRVLVCRDSQPDAPCYASDERGFIGMLTPTPVPPGVTPPPTPIPPLQLPAGPARDISWTLSGRTGSSWGTINWSADAHALGLAPASWHMERVEDGLIALSSQQLWVQDDILNNRSSFGGSAGGSMPPGIYRIKVCNAGHAQCVTSASQLAFVGTAQVTVQPTPARTVVLPCPPNPQPGSWAVGQQYTAGTVVHPRNGGFYMKPGNGATSHLVGLFGAKQSHTSSPENEPYRSGEDTVSYDPALWEVVGGMLPPCVPPSPTPPTPTQFIPTQTPTRLPVVSNAQPHATRTASVSGAAYRYQPARPPMAPNRG